MRSSNTIKIIVLAAVFIICLLGVTNFVVRMNPPAPAELSKSDLLIPATGEYLLTKDEKEPKKIETNVKQEEPPVKEKDEEIYTPEKTVVVEEESSDAAKKEVNFPGMPAVDSLQKTESTALPAFTPIYTPPPSASSTAPGNTTAPLPPFVSSSGQSDSARPPLEFPAATNTAPPQKTGTTEPLTFTSDRSSQGPLSNK